MSKIKNSPITSLLKGILISYCFTMAIFIIYALLITYTDISEDYISPLSLIVTSLSCLASGFAAAKSAKSRGLLWGVLAGGLYMLIMFTLGYTTIPTYQLNQKFVISLALALGGGGLGGIFGVNR
jgi:putative membrane protein, TIGR04086 family